MADLLREEGDDAGEGGEGGGGGGGEAGGKAVEDGGVHVDGFGLVGDGGECRLVPVGVSGEDGGLGLAVHADDVGFAGFGIDG